MRKIVLLALVVAVMPFRARAFNTYDTYNNNNTYNDSSNILAYAAMPLAVSSVCDVPGVQTDRVGELVSYMDQANVAPADFDDVLRYVPVALVMRTDNNRPDFVEWVHQQVDQGVVGAALVASMEAQLRTYDNAVPVYQAPVRRHYRRAVYAYDTYGAYGPDYVPTVIVHHCHRLWQGPMALLEMPLAATDVYDLGLPYDRVSALVIQLNLGDVPPLQFVELMRYAPAALAYPGGYYGQPDLVQYVQAERSYGVTGYPLVQAVDQQLVSYNVTPAIDPPPVYTNQSYYVPPVAQNYVDPVYPTAYVPPAVHTQVATSVAAGRAFSAQPPAPAIAAGRGYYAQPQAPAVAAAPQVQRLLSSPNGGAVVTNPAQARRELARSRFQREAPVAAAPNVPAPAVAAPAFVPQRGRAMARRSFAPVPAAPAPQRVITRQQRAVVRQVPIARPQPVPQRANAQPAVHGRGHGRAFTPMMSSSPAPVASPEFRGRAARPAVVQRAVAPPPAPAARAVAPPQVRQAAHGHGVPPGQQQKHGKGHV